jgi:hypothetical protein
MDTLPEWECTQMSHPRELVPGFLRLNVECCNQYGGWLLAASLITLEKAGSPKSWALVLVPCVFSSRVDHGFPVGDVWARWGLPTLILDIA